MICMLCGVKSKYGCEKAFLFLATFTRVFCISLYIIIPVWFGIKMVLTIRNMMKSYGWPRCAISESRTCVLNLQFMKGFSIQWIQFRSWILFWRFIWQISIYLIDSSKVRYLLMILIATIYNIGPKLRSNGLICANLWYFVFTNSQNSFFLCNFMQF